MELAKEVNIKMSYGTHSLEIIGGEEFCSDQMDKFRKFLIESTRTTTNILSPVPATGFTNFPLITDNSIETNKLKESKNFTEFSQDTTYHFIKETGKDGLTIQALYHIYRKKLNIKARYKLIKVHINKLIHQGYVSDISSPSDKRGRYISSEYFIDSINVKFSKKTTLDILKDAFSYSSTEGFRGMLVLDIIKVYKSKNVTVGYNSVNSQLVKLMNEGLVTRSTGDFKSFKRYVLASDIEEIDQ